MVHNDGYAYILDSTFQYANWYVPNDGSVIITPIPFPALSLTPEPTTAPTTEPTSEPTMAPTMEPTMYPTRGLIRTDCMKSGGQMYPGDVMYSHDGYTKLDMNSSGNWMLSSRKNSTSNWEMKYVHTSMTPRWVLQWDGNVVVYGQSVTVLWALNTAGMECFGCQPAASRTHFILLFIMMVMLTCWIGILHLLDGAFHTILI